VAEHPAGPYRHVETVIGPCGSLGWNRITAHNVNVARFDGRYYLYRIGTNDGGRGFTEGDLVATARVGYAHPNWLPLRNNQRTGVAVARRPEGPWLQLAHPVVEPGGPVSTVAVNPDVWQTHDGRYHMIFKGDYPGVGVAQALAIAERPEGPFCVQPELVFAERRTEDSSTFADPVRGLRYAVLHDLQGFGLLVSADDVHWQRARHYRAMDKRIARADGGELAHRSRRPRSAAAPRSPDPGPARRGARSPRQAGDRRSRPPARQGARPAGGLLDKVRARPAACRSCSRVSPSPSSCSRTARRRRSACSAATAGRGRWAS
jgi:hypothetical protein